MLEVVQTPQGQVMASYEWACQNSWEWAPPKMSWGLCPQNEMWQKCIGIVKPREGAPGHLAKKMLLCAFTLQISMAKVNMK